MNLRHFAPKVGVLTLGLLVLGGLASAQALATKPATAKKAWTMPRTPDGHPDFQGVWTNNTRTPLQRPKELGAKEFYTEEELANLQKREQDRLAKNEEDGRPTEPGTAADVHYDFAEYGLDPAQAKQVWNRRTSMIVGPEGSIPPQTPEARKRIADANAKLRGHEFDGPESRPLGARCLAFANVGPPLLPAGYNSNLQIVQGANSVVIETEMIHDARVVDMTGRPHPAANIRQWKGDSIGHWEGDTLVIDTTNFTDQTPYAGAENLHVIERLTRVDNDTIKYEFKVEDPSMWTKPWAAETYFSKVNGLMYEYACHEANYGLANTLSGARVAEKEGAAKK
ncbi:MAG: hypothetical protein JO307_05640 [Bryobacterales bacterium]|nr:hypothetical protein [Bryobacterales bacterium]MBV9399983.1 hypothetical protein [Bryobacterales bacterium]